MDDITPIDRPARRSLRLALAEEETSNFMGAASSDLNQLLRQFMPDTTTTLTDDVDVFIGIRYAMPPVDDRRFMPPVKEPVAGGVVHVFDVLAAKQCWCKHRLQLQRWMKIASC